jgi:hypothetical protein
VLANEYLACRLAQIIGLRVPEPVIINVDAATIREQQLTLLLEGQAVAPNPGTQFGSRLITDEQVFDWLPQSVLRRVSNRREFAGMLAFDKWTGNADGRQVIFHKRLRQRRYTATSVDFGYCFNGGDWSFPDSPLRGAYFLNEVYEDVKSWRDFAPWLDRIERLSAEDLQRVAHDVPADWHGHRAGWQHLPHLLWERRLIVRRLIEDFRTSNRNPFPGWENPPEPAAGLRGPR